MRLGEILVGRGLVSVAQVEAAVQRQHEQGGRLGENLIAMGLLTQAQLDDVLDVTPPSPQTVEATGIAHGNLMNLMLKFMHQQSLETLPDLSAAMKLPQAVIQELMSDAIQRKLVQALGSINVGIVQVIRYSLSERGRVAALEAITQNLYIGPAPVPLAAYQTQILRQKITNEVLDRQALESCFKGLVIPDHFLRKLGPAINAGRTLLLFGPAGNGKTTIATRIANLFRHVIYVPYAVEIDGQIMKVHDHSLHKPAVSKGELSVMTNAARLRREGFDERWAACKRPVGVAGGELTLEMLDLQFNDTSKFYEAPLHVKSLNGVFVVDDFGRQQVSPEHLLNRWIVPMENRIDYMKLNTGKSFLVPFDVLLIFSTNLSPADLMDPAFLRRIPYKIKLDEPSRADYRRIFDGVSHACGLELPDEVFDYIVARLMHFNCHLAFYQPKFICDQVVEGCKYEGRPARFSRGLVDEALANLYVQIADQGAGA